MFFLRTVRTLAPLAIPFVLGCNKPAPLETKPDAAATAEVVGVKGIDTSKLTPRERRELAKDVSELLAPCLDVPVSIAACVNEGRPCKACMPAAELLLKQIQAGKSKQEREAAFHARFDTDKVQSIATEGSPDKGPADAPVTVVEWADFECPSCRGVYPFLDDLTERMPGQVRVVFKFYPLSGHPHGEISARAAVAAFRQGKFWEMHHMMFDNQDRLEQADLERYAKEIGLDVVKFKTDLVSKETGERIEKDKKQAETIGLDGTPYIFIDGRYVNFQYLAGADDIADWVKVDLELKGIKPKQLPKPSPSSAPSSSAPAAGPSNTAAGKSGDARPKP